MYNIYLVVSNIFPIFVISKLIIKTISIMMTVGTITGLLDELKKSAVKEHTNTKMDNDKGFLDAPAINQELNDMLNNIIIELETLRMKEQISQEDFDSLVEFAEKYTNKIHI